MSEIKFLQEQHYLQQLSREFIRDYPHLADVLDPHDEQSGSLLEGFAFLSARLQEKVDDAFPEITLPLLQRLQSRAIKVFRPRRLSVSMIRSKLISRWLSPQVL